MDIVTPGPSTNDFPPQSEIRWKIPFAFIHIQSDHHKILHIAQQLCCRGMSKSILPYDGQEWN